MTYEGKTIAGQLADPLVECVAELARRLGPSFDPSRLAMLPRGSSGWLPGHQAEAALEMADLPFEPRSIRQLPVRASEYPALVEFGAGQFALILDARDGDLLLWQPLDGEVWVARSELKGRAITRFLAVFGNPDAMRADEAPWHAKGRTHWFWNELRKERAALWPILVASTVLNLLAVALPLFTMNVYDRVIPNRAGATLWVLAIGVILAFTLEFMLRRARTAVVDEASHRLDLKLSQKIFSRILATPLVSPRGHTGALAARVAEYAIVRDFFASTTVVLIVDVIFLFVFVGVMAIISGWLALVPVVIMAGMAIAGWILQKKVVDAARDAQADAGLQQTLLVESLAGMETLKSLSGESGMVGRWRRLAEVGSHSQMRLRSINSLAIGLAQTFQQVSSVALVIGGYYLFAAGTISMGAIIAVVMLASRSLAPAGQIAFLLTRGRQANETLASIEMLFDGEDERRASGNLTLSGISRPTITLDKLSFRYPGASQSALNAIDLTIRAGEKVAIVGRVASGKSTLGRVLCGLYAPTEGAMLVGGIDSRQYRPQQIRDAFRYVGQDAAIFTGSIKDNLALGKRDASDDRLIAALRATGAEEFLSQDGGGFDRPVGENGRSLSGGQRAFLALSRALVSPCELLFLDEPTGAMDAQTESLFVERLSHALTEDQTLVVSTHRPALFSLCDRLVVLDNGRVVADGPVQEVIARSVAEPR
ncbi:ATP-binding cassette domain-containing protein [Altererythrobacter sp. TH136]|uniref:ATP-binding cassette domain-containing protein n=1 Tax=Altererythrobacter sp. TH136 TaxID=2067415 RepID=UPI0011648874|nr:ATP-binding cassette domain-containing protein [Altererythrobacter sp. TH136]QDM41815.1 ATP-binding cassette domain-containing protein [Altererythrobacter sp. TH136]